MRYFIVEDDKSIVNILKRIITERNLGQVVDFALDGKSAVEKIKSLEPDIVLVDLFIPKLNGIQLVQALNQEENDMSFVMISSVSNKDMIAKAYESGIETYIHKPINAVEVESVLRRVMEYRDKTSKLDLIKSMFKLQNLEVKKSTKDSEKIIKLVLQKIGVLGESGTQDIVNVVSYLINSNTNLSECTIKEICEKFDTNYKSVEQRIRRTAMMGLTNLAYLGNEDYMNDVYIEYSSGLYNLSEVKCEMDYIKGKTNVHGKVSIRKFIEGIVFYCEKIDME